MVEGVELKDFVEHDIDQYDWAIRGCKAGQAPRKVQNVYYTNPQYPEFLRSKYQAIEDNEQRWESYYAEDADVVLVAYGISSRISKEAVNMARAEGFDLCLLDVKSGDEETYHKVTGGTLQPTIDFGQRLAKAGKKIWVRFVLVPGLTDSEENVENVAKICETFGVSAVAAAAPAAGGPARGAPACPPQPCWRRAPSRRTGRPSSPGPARRQTCRPPRCRCRC